ncbi:hypothetical protein DW980_03910 [Bacteroides stercoris]|nr:hypothetical protein DXD55_10785 [Bacteroides stercoris]RGZ66269.1 hypothetical protein DW980_03910 [Bacteroides stercoris]
MPKRMIPLSSRKRGRWSYLFFRGKITIYKFTPQVFTLTHKNPFFSFPLFPHIIIEQMAFTYKRSR